MKYFLVPALILVSLCSLAAPHGRAGALPDASLNLENYLAELDRWSGEAMSLKEHPERAAALRKALPKAWQVDIRGQHFTVPTDWLRQTLDSLEVNHWLAGDYSKEMQVRLALMRSEAEALEQPSAVGPGAAQNKLDEILRRREFREVRGPSWFEQLRDRVANWIADFLVKMFGGLSSHPSVGNLLLWVIIGALVSVLLISLIRYFLRGAGGTKLDLEGPSPSSRTWKDWARDALSAAGRADYREAIRLSYWAGIFRLEELGMWQVDRARTHREYLRLLAADDSHRPPLAAITSRFELVWYGGNPASAEDFESVLTHLETLGCKLRWRPATANS